MSGPRDDSYFRVMLSNGRSVDLLTKWGAHEFLEEMGSRFISANRLQYVGVREVLGSLPPGPQRDQAVTGMISFYTLVGCVSDTQDLFKLCVPRSECQCFTKHATDVFENLQSNREWTQTGVMCSYDQELLDTLTPLTKHVVVCELLLEDGVLTAMAELCAALEPISCRHRKWQKPY